MKGFVVHGNGECKVEELPVPGYDVYSCLVRMESCGICSGTDMKIIHRVFKGVEQYPLVLGHEGVARVVEMGAKVKNYRIGDLVLMPYMSEVPEGYGSAWGTFAEYNIITDAKTMADDGLTPEEFMWAQQVIPTSMDPVAASMVITFREVLSTMRTFGFEPKKSIAILGLGPVGLSFVKFAGLLGMEPIIAMDIDGDKLALAANLGADACVNAAQEDIAQKIRETCPEGIDFALDAVGVPSFINTALDVLKSCGRICVYGISSQMNASVDWSRCPYNWTLQFNQFPSKLRESEALEQILEWIGRGILDPAMFISEVHPFQDINLAFERVAQKQVFLKSVIRF